MGSGQLSIHTNYNVSYPVRRTGKHGETTLMNQRKLFVQDLTVLVDVEANPGPDQLLNEIVSRSAQERVTGIELFAMNNNGIMIHFVLFVLALPFPATFFLLLRIMECSRPVVAELESVLERKSTEYRHYLIFIIIHLTLLR